VSFTHEKKRVYIELYSLGKTCLHWTYFIWLAEGVATTLCCVKLAFMLLILSL